MLCPRIPAGCPAPTVTPSPGRAQLVSSPVQDGWGQAGDTPESLHTHGQPPASPEPPDCRGQANPGSFPVTFRRKDGTSVTPTRPGAPPAEPDGGEPPGTARGGGRGYQPSGLAAGLISATGCHSGCSQPRGHSERCGDPWQRRAEPLHPQHVWQPVGTAGGTAGGLHGVNPPAWGDGARQRSGQGEGGDSTTHGPCLSPHDPRSPERLVAGARHRCHLPAREVTAR